jgi:hypothetical protein
MRPRVVLGAHAPLLLHHLEFALELVVRPLVVGEAVGLQLHHVLQPVRSGSAGSSRCSRAGEGVLAAAQGATRRENSPGASFWRALEQHVFQHVGDAAGAVDFVHRADAHVHHVDGRRRAPIRLDDDVMPLASCNWTGFFLRPAAGPEIWDRAACACAGGPTRESVDENRPPPRAQVRFIESM